jgi:hypothetical protein
MLHACLYTICFVFCYTLWHFYAFSRTNLITRRHSVSSLCFCYFCVSEKLHRKYYWNWMKQKPNLLFFHNTSQSPKQRQRGARTWPHPRAAGAKPWPRHQGWAPLVHFLMPPFRLYIPLDGKNLNTRSIFHKTYCKPPPSSTWDREGPEALLGTLPERGITAGGLLHHHGRLRSDVWVVYLGLRVHSSS